MNFNSLNFLVFFPIVLLLYWRLPHKFRWILLLIASYYFYMCWNVSLVFLILGTTAIAYFSAIGIEKSEGKGKRKVYLILTLVLCLGCLAVFKYLNFFLENTVFFIRLFGGSCEDLFVDLILPVGISFYTFQTLSYVIDVYRGTVQAEKHFGYFALYVSFFPQLVAGPIERPENLIPQLHEEHKFQETDMLIGFRYMLGGFCKKVVIGDLLAAIVENVYAVPNEANGFSILIATVCFALQIYCDFSGYSEIAIGVARMMGIRLMKNFDKPYTALGIRDFWKRWHLSLTDWFTDYLYIPLGGNRKGTFRRCLNTLIVFTVSGLWHGANWTFLAWGIIHGLLFIAEILLNKPWKMFLGKVGISNTNKFYRAFVWCLTFALVCFAWIFFRAENMQSAFLLVKNLFTAWEGNWWIQSLELFDVSGARLLLLPLGAVLLLSLNYLPKERVKELPLGEKASESLLYYHLLLAVAVAWFILLANGADSMFIYFQF